jgi:hypothetical protein
MHGSIAASVKATGATLGKLHAASEAHEKHTRKVGGHPAHHHHAAKQAGDVQKLAVELRKCASDQVKLAVMLESMASVAADSHRCACEACKKSR